MQIEAQRLLEVVANNKSPLTFNIADEIKLLVAEVLKEEKEERKKNKQARSVGVAGIMARVLAAARKPFQQPPATDLPPLPPPIAYR
jgi:hypothetical protein